MPGDRFKKTIFGYDPREVDEYVETEEDDVRNLKREVIGLRESFERAVRDLDLAVKTLSTSTVGAVAETTAGVVAESSARVGDDEDASRLRERILSETREFITAFLDRLDRDDAAAEIIVKEFELPEYQTLDPTGTDG